MAHIIITVDNITLLNDNLGDWMQQPPPDLQALMKPPDPQPWHRATMIVMTEALLTNQPTHIDIHTHTHTHGWTMNVTPP